ncbi:hypothetical protein QYE76_043986 [Lolium multiflorum]|uniref:Transposase (putative) gypsy type domain-containing protein n=1 Tax=Lolium multiflorum TaxID=4521 RepID=A0AAD8TK49_LOLMU|nr:hypothetical protein QYE76_043986 [Lolium multiflorum]
MGKKKGARASEATKVSRDWSASAISNRDINKLRSLGFISASEDDIRLPARQLTPNSILHLSIFVTVCEAFLGIDPHWGLWKKIFYMKRHNDSNGPPSLVASALLSGRRVSSANLSADDLRDEVRRLTCLSKNDNIVLMSARPPYDADHPPTEALATARSYPPTPESGVDLEDDDEDSDGTEDARHVLEDSDVQGERPLKMTLHQEGVGSRYTMILSLRLNQVLTEAIMMPIMLLRLLLPRRAQQASSQAKMILTLLEANRLAADAKNENVLLKEEVKKLKQQLKDEQDAKHAAAALLDKKEGTLRESIKELLDSFIFFSC